MSRPLQKQCRPSRHSQRGVALAIVVWFIAGMSLLVAGIVSVASVDTRMTQLHVARAKVSAAGDGAVQLLLADLVSGRLPGRSHTGPEHTQYRLGDIEVAVNLVPTAGLIDLNSATPELLAALFTLAGGVDRVEAESLADNVVDWRRPASVPGGDSRVSSRFREVEDLLRVEGIGRTLLDGVREYVVAGNAARGGMDWSRAPPAVFAVLQEADERKYAAVARRRARLANAVTNSPTGKNPGGSGAYRADAVVRYGDRTWLRRHWVVLESTGNSLLPWRILRTEAARVRDSSVMIRE